MKNIKILLSIFIILSFLTSCTAANKKVDETTTPMPESAEITTVEEETPYPDFEIEVTSDEKRIYEKMVNYVFIPDDKVLGEWQVVDYVQNIEDFNPNVTTAAQELNIWESVTFLDKGILYGVYYSDYMMIWKWTKGYILDIIDIIPKYIIKHINGTDYIFIEWKREENYLFNGEKPYYFVFKKVAGKLSEDDLKYYYLNHYNITSYLNEEWYKTVLGDISKVGKGEPIIAWRDLPMDFSRIIRFDESSLISRNENWGYDMRSCDVSQMDLSVIESYNYITFDSSTKFPNDSAKLPKDFDAEYILEFNKNPGLGIRALHEQGITGADVSIAIIDQNLLVDHEQYKENLMYYEKIHCTDDVAQIHGPTVASIAIGKDIGVAPDAKLYYIAETHGHFSANRNFEFDASIIADCILRILDINKNLPENEKIRVISISRGYDQTDKGYKEITAAIDKANTENVFVVTTSTEAYYKNFNLAGADRDYFANPDDFKSYEPASWLRSDLYSNNSSAFFQKQNIFPMGSRTYASCTGTENYEIAHDGGFSWAVPWCAGFYALCCQVKPDITPQEFIEIVNSTSVPAETVYNDKIYMFGNIINPAEVIKMLQNK